MIKNNVPLLIALVGVVVTVDQLSKYWWQSQAMLNDGVAFGWGGAVSSAVMSSFLTLLAVGITGWWFKHAQQYWLSGGLFLGGVWSNLIDRWWLGGVRDWLPLPLTPLQNNLADWAIALGVIILCANFIRRSRSGGN